MSKGAVPGFATGESNGGAATYREAAQLYLNRIAYLRTTDLCSVAANNSESGYSEYARRRERRERGQRESGALYVQPCSQPL
jgi:hypothetical protein